MRFKNPFNNRRHNAPRSTRLPHKNPAEGEEYEGIVNDAEASILRREYGLTDDVMSLVAFVRTDSDEEYDSRMRDLMSSIERFRRGSRPLFLVPTKRSDVFTYPERVSGKKRKELASIRLLRERAEREQDTYLEYMANVFTNMRQQPASKTGREYWKAKEGSDVDRMLFAQKVFGEAAQRAEGARIFADPNWRARLGLDRRRR